MQNNLDKEKKSDRILVLEPIPGETVKSSTSLNDPRLWKGGNKLHAIRDPQTTHWMMKYESGGLPEALKSKYTSFTKLVDDVKVYFAGRGLTVKEIVD